VPNAQKIEKVAALKDRIQSSEALLLAEYRGLSVHDATELRRSLSEHARFAIVKNTLFERAAADAGVAELRTLLEGPTAVAFVQDDVVATAKKVVDAAKKFPALVIKGGYLDGKILSAAEAQALATLESREVMLSKIAGMLKSEMTRAASMFQTLQGRFVGLLEAYKGKLPGEEEPADAAEEPAAEASQEAAVEAPEGPPAEAPEEPPAEAPEEPPAEAPEEPPAEAPEEPPAEAVAGSADDGSTNEPETEQQSEPTSEEG
jgi:large subunit ribosomal protein L10